MHLQLTYAFCILTQENTYTQIFYKSMWRIEVCRTIDADKNIQKKKHLPTYLPYYFQPMLPQLHHFFLGLNVMFK